MWRQRRHSGVKRQASIWAKRLGIQWGTPNHQNTWYTNALAILRTEVSFMGTKTTYLETWLVHIKRLVKPFVIRWPAQHYQQQLVRKMFPGQTTRCGLWPSLQLVVIAAMQTQQSVSKGLNWRQTESIATRLCLCQLGNDISTVICSSYAAVCKTEFYLQPRVEVLGSQPYKWFVWLASQNLQVLTLNLF